MINGCKLQQKQTFNLMWNDLALIAASGVFPASSFNEDEVVLRVLKIWLEVRYIKASL